MRKTTIDVNGVAVGALRRLLDVVTRHLTVFCARTVLGVFMPFFFKKMKK